MLDRLRRWRERRRLLREAAELEREAVLRDEAAERNAHYSRTLDAVIGAALGIDASEVDSMLPWREGTEAMRAKARALREEADRL